MTDWKERYRAGRDSLEDFWGRRDNGAAHVRDAHLFGRPLRLTTNQPDLLAVLDLALPLYSTAPAVTRPPYRVHLIARGGPVDPGPPPDHLMPRARYSGHQGWAAIEFGGWGHATLDLASGRAVAVLDPRLVARPDVVADSLMNTLFTNFAISGGFGMLHATGLVQGQRLLLLMAPHNSGKSTTALHLTGAGFRLLSDSQIYITPDQAALMVLGFPVGRIKLRGDMVGRFPEYTPHLQAEQVRDETKYRLPLGEIAPSLVVTGAVQPEGVDLCLLATGSGRQSRLRPASRDEVEPAVIANSIFFDDEATWLANLAQIERCLARADFYHFEIGSDPAGLAAALEPLASSRGPGPPSGG